MRRDLLLALGLALLGGCGSPRDVLLVTVDTLRADHLGAHGSDLGLTPRLDALAVRSVVFERAYAPSSYTLPSMVSLLTGRHSEEAGVDYNTHRLGDVPSLAEHLAARGWRTGAVVSNYVLGPRSGMQRGFEHYDATLEERERVRGFYERTARPTTDAALAMLDLLLGEPRRPVFLWVHYQDPHGPYTPPPGFREAQLDAARSAADGTRKLPVSQKNGFGGIPPYQLLRRGAREVAFYRAGYRGEIAHVDEEIGRFLDGATERGVFEDAIVIFAADHGEALGEADLWFAHGELLIEPLVHVPLWFRLPGHAPGRRADVASLLDVVPSLAGALGLPPPAEQRGRDLFTGGAEAERPVVYLALPGHGHAPAPRFGLIADDHKYVLAEGGLEPGERLVRLGADAPDRLDADPIRAAAMRETLEGIRSGLPETAHVPLSLEERRALQALGYAPE